MQVGYGIIETENGSRVDGVALYSSSNAEGTLMWEAAVGAVEPIERGRVYVEQKERTRTALANPGDQDLSLTAVLCDEHGMEVDRQDFPLDTGMQTAKFVDEWFADAFSGPGVSWGH